MGDPLDFYRIVLAILGGLCAAVGIAFEAIELASLFSHFALNQRPPLGMGLLLLTTGIIAIRLAKD